MHLVTHFPEDTKSEDIWSFNGHTACTLLQHRVSGDTHTHTHTHSHTLTHTHTHTQLGGSRWNVFSAFLPTCRPPPGNARSSGQPAMRRPVSHSGAKKQTMVKESPFTEDQLCPTAAAASGTLGQGGTRHARRQPALRHGGLQVVG